MRVVSCLTTGRLSGVDVFAVQLTRGLTRLGHEAEILLTEPSLRVPDPMPLPRDVAVRQMPAMSKWLVHRRRQWLYDYLVDRSPCVYLPNYDYRHSTVSAALPAEVIVVGHIHSDDPLHYDHARLLHRFWNATVAVSQAVAKRTADACPDATSRLVTIPYGVPTPAALPERQRHGDRPLQVLYTGRIDQRQKRALDLVESVEKAIQLGAHVQLTVVGAGEALGKFLSKAGPLIERDAIRMLPTVPNEQLAGQYAQADVFLLPSAFEGLPLSLLEAMGHGCVPLVSDISSGIPELVEEGVEGFRVAVGDVIGFAGRLKALAGDRQRLARMSQAAFDKIAGSPYRAEIMTAHYAELFKQLDADAQAGRFVRPQPGSGEIALQGGWNGLSRRARRLAGRGE